MIRTSLDSNPTQTGEHRGTWRLVFREQVDTYERSLCSDGNLSVHSFIHFKNYQERIFQGTESKSLPYVWSANCSSRVYVNHK